MSDPALGWVAPAVREDFPALALWSVVLGGAGAGAAGRTTADLKRRLRVLSDRWAGARAIALRREPVPHAYRVFFRQVGLDPDEQRTPVEEAVLERLKHGGFRSRGRLHDALLVALVETGVPVWALDAARVTGRLGVGGDRARLTVADEDGAIAPLFGPLPEDRLVGEATADVVLFTVQVAGVPAIHVEEALWTVTEAAS